MEVDRPNNITTIMTIRDHHITITTLWAANIAISNSFKTLPFHKRHITSPRHSQLRRDQTQTSAKEHINNKSLFPAQEVKVVDLKRALPSN